MQTAETLRGGEGRGIARSKRSGGFLGDTIDLKCLRKIQSASYTDKPTICGYSYKFVLNCTAPLL